MILKCSNLNKKYSGFNALKDINVELKTSQIIGLLGPNGSGKTTLIKCINSLTPKTSGEISIDDTSINYKHDQIIAYLPDIDFLPKSMNAKDISDYYSDFFEDFNKEKFAKMVENFSLPSDKPFSSLSKGMKKKLQIAATISRNASFYFLDEPLGGIDLVARKQVIEQIIENYNENACLVISTHLIGEVENILDRVIMLKSGEIAIDSDCESIRESENKSISNLYMEVYHA